MKTNLKRIVKSTLITLALAFASTSLAEVKTNMSNAVEKKVEQSNEKQLLEQRQKITQEASAAIQETQNALKALNQKKKKESLPLAEL